MHNNKTGISHLTEICVRKGVKTIVISPGSRNAPVILSFTAHPSMECLSIVDERSAAFFALGMAQQTGETIAIACTSGTAALNFAPAIAEAFYQKIPLLVLTADRPTEWIDQADSQTIRQKDIYSNYIKRSYELPQNISSDDDVWHLDRMICEAIDTCRFPDMGPVHINLPFTEPLYEQSPADPADIKIIETIPVNTTLEENLVRSLAEKWDKYSKKLILAGMLEPDLELNEILDKIAEDGSVSVLTETTSNLFSERFNPCIDRVVSSITDEEAVEFQPELLITIGTQVISKKVKAFLRKHKPVEHWHIDPDDLFLDTYQSLTLNIPASPAEFLNYLSGYLLKDTNSLYSKTWKDRDLQSDKYHAEYLSECEFSDLKAFDILLKKIPAGINLHLGNSTPVRYVQLFRTNPGLKYNSNRGTSGIDGTVSTAAGAAFKNSQPTTLITGDLAFFYDSNGLWNKYLSDDLRIIIINNEGGGIFRFIDGPSETEVLEQYFETTHQTNAEGIASTFGLKYFKAKNQEELVRSLESFYHPQNKTASILEIFTPREKNAVILKEYFRHLSGQ